MGNTFVSFSFTFSNLKKDKQIEKLEKFDDQCYVIEKDQKTEPYIKLSMKSDSSIYKFVQCLQNRNAIVKDSIQKVEPKDEDEEDEEDEDSSESEYDNDSSGENGRDITMDDVVVDDNKPNQLNGDIITPQAIDTPVNFGSTLHRRSQKTKKEETIEVKPDETLKKDNEDTEDDLYGVWLSRSLAMSFHLIKDLYTTNQMIIAKKVLENQRKNTIITYTDLNKEFDKALAHSTKVNLLVETSGTLAAEILRQGNASEPLNLICRNIISEISNLDKDYTSLFQNKIGKEENKPSDVWNENINED